MYNLIINEEQEGVKPKNFLKKTFDISFSQTLKYIRKKQITLNKKKIRGSETLKKGDIITIWNKEIKLREKGAKNQTSKNLNIEIIYENENFFILNKPPKVICQGAQDNQLSLSFHLNYLKKNYKDETNFSYTHAHRLDKDTTGCLLVARNQKTLRELNRIFNKREITKLYHCIVLGKLKEKKKKITLYMQRNQSQNSKRKVIVTSPKSKESKKTELTLKVLKEFESQEEQFSLVEITLHTGFTHQIRVTMAHLRHPILSDTMYGNSYINSKFEHIMPQQALHARCLKFQLNNEKFNFTAPYLRDIRNFLKNIESKPSRNN